VAKEILSCFDESDWFKISISHLRDFVDFDLPAWTQFINGNARAFQTISRPREVSMRKLVNWIDRQISPALSVAVDVLPQEVMDSLLRRGRKKRGSRYDILLQSQIPGSAGGIRVSGGRPSRKPRIEIWKISRIPVSRSAERLSKE
jgi:hypothetical protein